LHDGSSTRLRPDNDWQINVAKTLTGAPPAATKQRLAALVGLHGRTDGPPANGCTTTRKASGWRATMHKGAGDYRPQKCRIMRRTIVCPN